MRPVPEGGAAAAKTRTAEPLRSATVTACRTAGLNEAGSRRRRGSREASHRRAAAIYNGDRVPDGWIE